MDSTSKLIVAALVLLCLAHVPRSHAQDERRFEITPMIGYRGGEEFDALVGTERPDANPSESYGIALSMSAAEAHRYELLYTFQPTDIEGLGIDLDIEHLHIGVSATYLESDTIVPFIAAGIGATRFKPDRGDDETRFSGSLALGFGLPINDQIHVRLEARGYFVSMDRDSQLFCSSGPAGGNCLVRAAGNTFFQSEALLGVGIGFGSRTSR